MSEVVNGARIPPAIVTNWESDVYECGGELLEKGRPVRPYCSSCY